MNRKQEVLFNFSVEKMVKIDKNLFFQWANIHQSNGFIDLFPFFVKAIPSTRLKLYFLNVKNETIYMENY